MVSPCRRTCSIALCISSGTNYPLHFSCLLQFLFVSHYQDLFSNTHDHLCFCSYHPEILTCVSSVLLLNVHTWINVRCLSSFFDAWVNYIVCLCFLNENRVKPGKKRGLFAFYFFTLKFLLNTPNLPETKLSDKTCVSRWNWIFLRLESHC